MSFPEIASELHLLLGLLPAGTTPVLGEQGEESTDRLCLPGMLSLSSQLSRDTLPVFQGCSPWPPCSPGMLSLSSLLSRGALPVFQGCSPCPLSSPGMLSLPSLLSCPEATPGVRVGNSMGLRPRKTLGFGVQHLCSLRGAALLGSSQHPVSCQLCVQEENERDLQRTLKTLPALPMTSKSNVEVQVQLSVADISNVPLSDLKIPNALRLLF